MRIDNKQADILHGLFAHCASVHFDNTSPDYSFYADILDKAGVPWMVQNLVASAAENRNNVHGLYFKTVLKNNGIEITT